MNNLFGFGNFKKCSQTLATNSAHFHIGFHFLKASAKFREKMYKFSSSRWLRRLQSQLRSHSLLPPLVCLPGEAYIGCYLLRNVTYMYSYVLLIYLSLHIRLYFTCILSYHLNCLFRIQTHNFINIEHNNDTFC